MRTGMDSTYRHGYHCPKCGRKEYNTRRAPRCCGRVMVNDYDPRLIVHLPDPETVTLAEFREAVRAKNNA